MVLFDVGRCLTFPGGLVEGARTTVRLLSWALSVSLPRSGPAAGTLSAACGEAGLQLLLPLGHQPAQLHSPGSPPRPASGPWQCAVLLVRLSVLAPTPHPQGHRHSVTYPSRRVGQPLPSSSRGSESFVRFHQENSTHWGVCREMTLYYLDSSVHGELEELFPPILVFSRLPPSSFRVDFSV